MAILLHWCNAIFSNFGFLVLQFFREWGVKLEELVVCDELTKMPSSKLVLNSRPLEMHFVPLLLYFAFGSSFTPRLDCSYLPEKGTIFIGNSYYLIGSLNPYSPPCLPFQFLLPYYSPNQYYDIFSIVGVFYYILPRASILTAQLFLKPFTLIPLLSLSTIFSTSIPTI